MASSDDVARARLRISGDLADLDAARKKLEDLLAQVADVDARTIKPHRCHVCGTKTREKN